MKEYILKSLRTGNTSSCGCLRRELVASKNRVHGLSDLPEYGHWKGMRQRCNDPNHIKYPKYGDCGIKVCNRWDDFAAFLEDVGRMPTSKHSLDRFPNRNGNYEPGNVRWATASEQMRNRDCMDTVEYRGETTLVIDLAERFNMSAATLRSRLKRGWGIDDALSIPVVKGNNQCAKQKR